MGITEANLSAGAIVYIDANPLMPPTGGTNADGNLAGFTYDGTGFSSLPFRADFVTYFKDGYREYRNSDGTGGWTAATANFGTYASSSVDLTRELAIPWSAVIGSGMPSSFDFFAYLTDSGGFVFGQIPNGNPGAFIGTAEAYTQYFAVANTSLANPSFAFSDMEPQTTPTPEPSALNLLSAILALLALNKILRASLSQMPKSAIDPVVSENSNRMAGNVR